MSRISRFAYLCGASNAVCCWLRVPKLALSLEVILLRSRHGSSSASGAASAARRRLLKLLYIVGCIGRPFRPSLLYPWTLALRITFMKPSWSGDELIKSIFLLLGQYWYPALGISWYTIAPDLASEAVIAYDKFGMGPNAEVWEQYLISFYWVTTTLTVNGYVL